MHKEEAIAYIIDYASDLPPKEAMACHMAANDLHEYGIEDWIDWTPECIHDIFYGIISEASGNSIDKVESHVVGENFIDELNIEGYIGEGENGQERIDFLATMKDMRKSMLEGMEAMRTYYEIHSIIRKKYYGLY